MHVVDLTMFYAAEGGGVSTYLNAKARWLSEHGGMRHTIVSPNVRARSGIPNLQPIRGLALPGIHGYRMPMSVGACARRVARLQPDLVEAGDAGQCAWAALRLKRALGIPAVAFYHSDLQQLVGTRFGPLGARVAGAYLARLYRQFDLVLAPSRLMVAQLASLGVTGALHQPLGIDARIFCPGRRVDTLRSQLRLPPATRLLVYAGRFTPEKKLKVLAEAVRQLGAPYHLLMIGAGAAAPHGPQLSCLPFQRDQRRLARLLASCDALVHPGDAETFGLIVLEAMACGLPVLATRGGAVAELVEPGSGMLVEPNNAAALAAGIAALYRSDRAGMGRQAACRAREQHDWRMVLPQLMSRYALLLATRRPAVAAVEGACAAD